MSDLIKNFIATAWFDGAYDRKQALDAAKDSKVDFDEVEALFNDLEAES